MPNTGFAPILCVAAGHLPARCVKVVLLSGRPDRTRSTWTASLAWRWAVATWLVALTACSCGGPQRPPERWTVFYGVEAPPELLHGHDIVVLDPGYRGDLGAVRSKGAKVLAYLSLGELNRQRETFGAAERAGVLVRENPNWPGAFVVDLRHPAWTAIAVQEMALPLQARGFDGLFLDTLDSALALEREAPDNYRGMRQAAVALVTHLRARWPDSVLMVNGALELTGELREVTAAFAIESTFTTWDFQAKQARLLRPDERAASLKRQQAARAANLALRLYTLDYWDVEDRAGVRAIYAAQRQAGFVPYVATIALDRVVPEPAQPSAEDAPQAAAPP